MCIKIPSVAISINKQRDGKQTTADLTTSIYDKYINSSKNVVKYIIPQQDSFIHSLKVPFLSINLSHRQLEVVQASLIDRAQRRDKRQACPSHGGIYYTKCLA